LKTSNIAIFVPHNGCPHMCSFCNQREITGQATQPTPQDVVDAVEIALNSISTDTQNSEIGFFGGSFTAIDRQYMISLLKAAYTYVKSGQIHGIRLSTRPDCIDTEILDILKSYGVTSIELGAQSMDDDVLIANHRGHTPQDVINSSRLIKKYGFSLGLQMMTGLYKSDDQKDYYTAKALADLQPDTMRIYPTIVMKNTQLADLYRSGKYIVPALDNAVNLCAKLLQLFHKNNIKVIRLGLHSSDSVGENRVAGPWHPAFAELCQSEIFYNDFLLYCQRHSIGTGDKTVLVNPKSLSKFIGQKKSNIKKLSKLGYNIVVKADDTILADEIKIEENISK